MTNSNNRQILRISITSRIIVVLIILLVQATSNISKGQPGTYIFLEGDTSTSDIIYSSKSIAKADAGWYRGIAKSGYTKEKFSTTDSHTSQKNWAFFPGWPIFWSVFSLGTVNNLAGIVLANFLFVIGVIATSSFLKEKELATHNQILSFALISSYYPFSYFFSLPLPESLFFASTGLFLATAFRQEQNRHFTIVAFASGYISGLTRPTGIFNSVFTISEAIRELQHKKNQNPKRIKQLLLYAISPLLGLGTFMVYLYTITGNPLAFKDIQSAWGRSGGYPMKGLLSYFESFKSLTTVTSYSNFKAANFIVCIISIYCIVQIVIYAAKKLRSPDHNVFLDLIPIPIYLTALLIVSTSDNQNLLSYARIAGTNPIFYIGAAITFKPKLIRQLLPLMALILGAFTSLAVVGFNAFAA